MTHYDMTILQYGDAYMPAEATYGGFMHKGERILHPFTCILLQDGVRNILIDGGIDFRDPGKQSFRSIVNRAAEHPGQMLEMVGLACEDIDTVILTHLHIDHAGALQCYPRAQFYVQREELEKWEEVVADPKLATLVFGTVDPGDIQRARELTDSGRMNLLDGEVDGLFPGIDIRVAADGHSFSQNLVLIDTGRGVYIAIGDVANAPENLVGSPEQGIEHLIPCTSHASGGAYNMMKDYVRILNMVHGDVGRVIMTHDCGLSERFETEAKGDGFAVMHVTSN